MKGNIEFDARVQIESVWLHKKLDNNSVQNECFHLRYLKLKKSGKGHCEKKVIYSKGLLKNFWNLQYYNIYINKKRHRDYKREAKNRSMEGAELHGANLRMN